MLLILLALTVGTALAAYAYLARERLGPAGMPLLLARAIAVAALILLLINPTSESRATGGLPTVLLDASLSMGAQGGKWMEALDTAMARTSGGGTILRYGSAVELFDSLPPVAGNSLLGPALRSVAGSGAPVVVVTDGEVADFRSLPAGLTRGVEFITLPRASVPDAALQAVSIPERLSIDDSLYIDMNITTSGSLSARTAAVVVRVGGVEQLATEVDIPDPPGAVRRRVVLPPGTLETGFNVVELSLTVDGDGEPGDDVRTRIVEGTEQPAIVVLVDPADWEGRFLTTEVASVAATSVRGFARINDDNWIDMRNQESLSRGRVMALASGAALVFYRGSTVPNISVPVWHWPAGSSDTIEAFAGDWYVEGIEGGSPLTGRLAGLSWDSLPPLTSLQPLDPQGDDWTALTARMGRRGSARPVILGSPGMPRRLTTVGAGMWRWAFRGGAGREAYRAVVASGIDWLLDSNRPAGRELAVSSHVQRGQPLVFEWSGDSVPGGVGVTLVSDSISISPDLQFDTEGRATVHAPPGVYRWDAGELGSGMSVVENYSDEFRPMPPASFESGEAAGFLLIERYLRDRIMVVRARHNGACNGVGPQAAERVALVAGLWKKIKTVALTDVAVLARGGVDHDAIEDFERVLVEADLGSASFEIAESLEDLLRRGKIRKEEEVREWLTDRLEEIASAAGERSELDLGVDGEPGVILFVGVNGVGKTTQVAKVAHMLLQQGKSVMVAAADTYRAGAVDQLQVWAERLGVECVSGKQGGDPAAVAFDAVSAARSRGIDAVLIDTAGRLHTQGDLMTELSKVHRVCGKNLEGAPQEVLLVVDGTVGQNAVQQGRQFGAAVPLTGIIVTKLDGTARGGAVLSISGELGVPVRYLGTGETVESLQPFNAREFAVTMLRD